MENIILIAIIAVIIGCAARYVYKAKKSGRTCIGCPGSKECGGRCSCGCTDDASSVQ